MHEFSLIEAVVDSVEERSRDGAWGRVTKVTLKIGEMRQVIPKYCSSHSLWPPKGHPWKGRNW